MMVEQDPEPSAEPGSSGEGKADDHRAGDLVAPWLLVLGPFLAFLHLQGRSPFEVDSILVSVLIVALGLVAGAALTQLRGSVVYVLAVTALVLVFIDLQFPAGGHFRKIGTATLLLVWLLRQHVTLVASVGVAVLTVATLLTGPRDAVQRVDAGESSTPPMGVTSTGPPALVHLVLDEHAGLAGFNDQPEGREARLALERSYGRAGFRTYPNAFSEYSLTANALPNALNFTTEARFYGYVGGKGAPFPTTLPENAYFGRLKEAGYRIHVFQPTFVDLCHAQGAPADVCTTVPSNSLLTLDHLGLNAFERASVVFRFFLGNESYLYDKVRAVESRIRDRLGWNPPRRKTTGVTPGGALELLSLLESDVLAGPTRGTAYFAHLLLPHRPLFFDERCDSTARPLAYGAAAEPAYYAQVQCTTRHVLDFVDRIAAHLDEDAIVIVHGDHGARHHPLPGPGEDPVSDAVLIDRHSTLFTVRGSNLEPGLDEAVISIRDLLDQLSAHGFQTTPSPTADAVLFIDHDRLDDPISHFRPQAGWLTRGTGQP